MFGVLQSDVTKHVCSHYMTIRKCDNCHMDDDVCNTEKEYETTILFLPMLHAWFKNFFKFL